MEGQTLSKPPAKSPGEFIREELKKRGWTQEDLASVLLRTHSRVNEVVLGKQSISPEIAVALATAFGTAPELWLEREAAYRLSLLSTDTSVVRRRARLHELAPIKDLQKRSWLKSTDSLDELENDVRRFFRIASLDEEPSIHGAMRKTSPDKPASYAQRAWAFRVRQIAEAIRGQIVSDYDESKIAALQVELRKLAAFSQEVRKVPGLLMTYGIRFVAIEGLPGAKMDGFATWLDTEFKQPVIGMSLRYDRLDSFWFTLGHELAHIKRRDVAPVDADVIGQDDPLELKSPMERAADAESAAMLIPPEELQSFINRAAPYYSVEKIHKFASRIKIHPSIIIGQLKSLAEIKYSQHTKPLVPIRELVTATAVTEGWGKSINLGASS